jgi:hypothetical protein
MLMMTTATKHSSPTTATLEVPITSDMTKNIKSLVNALRPHQHLSSMRELVLYPKSEEPRATEKISLTWNAADQISHRTERMTLIHSYGGSELSFSWEDGRWWANKILVNSSIAQALLSATLETAVGSLK